MALPWKFATICCPRQDNKTLFIDYTNYPHPIHEGFYSPPGGKLNDGENPETAATRELWEEVGIKAKTLVYRGIVKFDNERRTLRGEPFKNNFQVHIYDCTDFNDALAQATEGRLVWVNDASILSLPLHEGDKTLWTWLKTYKEIEGTMIHKGEQLEKAILSKGILFS